LLEGIDDASYAYIFRPILRRVMEHYRPGAIVVCGGADSLSGDRLGCFNLSLEGHCASLEFLKSFGVPMLVLGGGGYTMRNVARCWAYETGALADIAMPDAIPASALKEYNYYMDNGGKLRIATSNMRNANTRENLDRIIATCLQTLSRLPPAPAAGQVLRATPPRADDEPDEGDGGGMEDEDGDLDARGGETRATADARARRDDERDGRQGGDGEGAGPSGEGGGVGAGGGGGGRGAAEGVIYDPKTDPDYVGPVRPADLAAAPPFGDGATGGAAGAGAGSGGAVADALAPPAADGADAPAALPLAPAPAAPAATDEDLRVAPSEP